MLLYGIDFVLSEGIFRRMFCKLKYRKEQNSFLKLLGKYSDWFDFILQVFVLKIERLGEICCNIMF